MPLLTKASRFTLTARLQRCTSVLQCKGVPLCTGNSPGGGGGSRPLGSCFAFAGCVGAGWEVRVEGGGLRNRGRDPRQILPGFLDIKRPFVAQKGSWRPLALFRGIQGDLRTPLCCPEICSRDSLLTSGPWRFKPVLSLLRLLSDLTVRKGSGITRRGCDILH